jgi:hypothetical protein
MTKEVQELYDALIKPAPYGYYDYEKLRARLIAEIGYDAFFERQHEALVELGRLHGIADECG